MQLLKEYIKSVDNTYVKESRSTILWFFMTNYQTIPKEEIEDFEQDIIMVILEALEKYDPNKGKFNTFLSWRLRLYKKDLITRFTGIKLTGDEYIKRKKKGGLFLQITQLEEGGKNDNQI